MSTRGKYWQGEISKFGLWHPTIPGEGGSSALIRNIISAPLEYNFCIFCDDQSISKGPKSHKQREEVQIQGCNEHND